MLADERPMLPMRFGIRMRLNGQLDPNRFREAFNTVVREQPLFCATISRLSGGWHWSLEDSKKSGFLGASWLAARSVFDVLGFCHQTRTWNSREC